MGEVIQNALPAQTAAAGDSTTQIGMFSTVGGTDNYISAARLIPPAGFTTVTGQATDNATFTLRRLSAGSVATANVATYTTSSGHNLVAETPAAMTINTATPWVGNEGDTYDVVMHQNGAGQAIGAGIVVVIEQS